MLPHLTAADLWSPISRDLRRHALSLFRSVLWSIWRVRATRRPRYVLLQPPDASGDSADYAHGSTLRLQVFEPTTTGPAESSSVSMYRHGWISNVVNLERYTRWEMVLTQLPTDWNCFKTKEDKNYLVDYDFSWCQICRPKFQDSIVSN